jgi:hypothetical protein
MCLCFCFSFHAHSTGILYILFGMCCRKKKRDEDAKLGRYDFFFFLLIFSGYLYKHIINTLLVTLIHRVSLYPNTVRSICTCTYVSYSILSYHIISYYIVYILYTRMCALQSSTPTY